MSLLVSVPENLRVGTGSTRLGHCAAIVFRILARQKGALKKKRVQIRAKPAPSPVAVGEGLFKVHAIICIPVCVCRCFNIPVLF